MHARYGTGKNHGTSHSLPPGIAPGVLEDEEQGQGSRTGEHSNDDGSDEVGELVRAVVVANGRIGEVVHAADGTAGHDSCEDDAPPSNPPVAGDPQKGEDQDEDWDQEGHDRQGGGVGDLKSFFAVEHVNSSVTDEVLFRRELDLVKCVGVTTSKPGRQTACASLRLTMDQMAMPPIAIAAPTSNNLKKHSWSAKYPVQ